MLTIVEDKRTWDSFCRRFNFNSIYVSFDYLNNVAQLEDNGKAQLAIFESKGHAICHPYIRRDIGEMPGVYDLISGYDFGGFWRNTKDEMNGSAIVEDCLTEFEAYCHRHQIVSEFIRFYPFIPVPDTTVYDITCVEKNVVVDLDKDYEKISRDYHPSLVRNIRKADRSAFELNESIKMDDFIELYYKNLDAIGSSSYYYFPKQVLSRLRNIQIVGAVDKGKKLCAAQVYLFDGDTVFYYLGASDRSELGKRPNDWLFDKMISRLSQKSYKRLHLGGGVSSLLKFKQKFSKEGVSYYIGKKIWNREIYKELERKMEEKRGISLADCSFFPKYRCET